jgi:phage N-6-adenine-methyltransferase
MTQQLLFGAAPSDPRDSWQTPRDVFDELDRVFNFSVDLAASDDNHLCDDYYTTEHSALDVDWSQLNGVVFANPPFSDIGTWVHKAQAGSRSVFLLPANRTDQAWFHNWVLPYAQIAFSRGRIQYVPAPGVKASSCAFGSMLAIYGLLTIPALPSRWTLV